VSAPALFWPGQQDESPYGSALDVLEEQPIVREGTFGPTWLRGTAPDAWRWDWKHQLALYPILNKIRSGALDRVIIVWPPRHTKTETATVRFPAYWLERAPDEQVIVAAHTQRLANKISRKIRRLAPGRFPLSSERTAVEEWETEKGGGLRAVGVGVAVAGHGGHLIFIDDPFKSRKDAESQLYRDRVWEWYTDDLYTRLEPGGSIVLVMTRWHEDDLVGRILASPDAPNWRVFHLPALALENDPLGRKPGRALCPERYDEKDLERIRVVEGSYGFASLYQGMPAPPEGGIFKRTWWNFWAPGPLIRQLPPVAIKLPDGSFLRKPAAVLPSRFAFEAQSWDMAFKNNAENDFVCGGDWGKVGANCYLLDLVKAHLDFPGTVKAMREFTKQHPNATAKWVEGKANGPAIIQTLRGELQGLIEVEPEGGKEARAHAVAALVEAGNVFLPHPALVQATDGHNWVEELIDSAATFPHASHDDDVDQMTQALNRLRLVPGDLGAPFGIAKARA
jgi:predicted phage terminase large subunit-like protein